MSLEDIPVYTESMQPPSQMVEAVLQELIQLLDAYLQDGQVGAIDIKSMPLSETDYEELKQQLGQGEITVYASLGGASNIFETQFAGVWWVTHHNMDDKRIAEYIEVGTIPAILCAHKADMQHGREQLAELMQTSDEKVDGDG